MYTETQTRFVSIGAKFGICTVVDLNGILVETKILTFSVASAYYSFNMCPIETNSGANAKFSKTREAKHVV